MANVAMTEPTTPAGQAEDSAPGAKPGGVLQANPHPSLHPTPPVPPLPMGGIMDARAGIRWVVASFGPAFGNIFLIPNPSIGILLWLSFLWVPRHALFALIGLAVALAIQYALGISEELKIGGGLRANSMLSAIAVGWMTASTSYSLQVSIVIAVAAATAAFITTASIMRVLRRSAYPSLLWGFCLSAGTILAIFPVATGAAGARETWWRALPTDPLGWMEACLRSIGSLMFVPRVEVGLIVILAVLLWSRTLLAAGLVGWITGALVSLFVQSLGVPFYWLPTAYNFFIAGMAMGAYFIIPGYASLLFAALAGAGTSLGAVALQTLMPTFAYLPTASALMIWGSIATLAFSGTRRGFWRNDNTNVPPEEAWWRENCWARRIGREEPLLVVPVPGPVAVAQGFEGTLSHRGALKHAFDFMRQSALPAPGSADFSIESTLWNAPVIAPAAGIVERVCDVVPDNALGMCNFADSWGNYVSVRLDQGGWALLAHLRHGSIAVKPGMRVELGDTLAAVGNSGRSPVPHLHLHVQNGPEPGSRTAPFRLANYLAAKHAGAPLLEWNASSVPPAGAFVQAAWPQPGARALLSSFSPGTSMWSVEHKGLIPRAFREHTLDVTFEVKVTLDEWGRYVFKGGDSMLLAALAPDAWRIIEQRGPAPLFKLLALGAPSLPYACDVGVSWTDIAPAVPAGPAAWLSMAFAPYHLQPFTYIRTMAEVVPAVDGGTLVTESVMAPRRSGMPNMISCTFDRLRGPIEVEATFDKGSLRYSLVSFSLSES